MSPSNGWAGMDSVGSPNSALKKGFAYRHPIQPQPKQAAQPIQHIRYVLNGRSVSPHFCTAAHLPDNHKWSSQYHRKVQGIQHHSRSRQFYSFFFISLLLFIHPYSISLHSISFLCDKSFRQDINSFPGRLGWVWLGVQDRVTPTQSSFFMIYMTRCSVLSIFWSPSLRWQDSSFFINPAFYRLMGAGLMWIKLKADD